MVIPAAGIAPKSEAGGLIPDEALYKMMEDLDSVETMAEAEAAPEPFVEGMVVQPTQDKPFGSNISEVTGPGWVFLYNTMTGEQIRVNRWNLRDALKKTHDDPMHPEYMGRPLFATKRTKKRVLGANRCLLHPKDPDAALYQSWGLPVCLSEHLASPFQVTQHMNHKHKNEWAAIQEYRSKRESDSWNKRQEEILLTLAQRAAIAPAPVATATVATGAVGEVIFPSTTIPGVKVVAPEKPKLEKRQRGHTCGLNRPGAFGHYGENCHACSILKVKAAKKK